MREALISILAILTVAPFVKTSDDGKDGFNLYKDYFRALSDDAAAPGSAEKMLYLYRTPLQLYPGLMSSFEQEYRKRTGNAFKNHLLSKELWGDDAAEGFGKRSSKTAISLIMQGKHPYYVSEDHYCPYGKRGRW